ncbi:MULTISPECIES: terminase large subunit domain-containing protein [Helicobacter]|uniref:terminase large subunit domain-containing protein n=1 Tax=Helicobacter TaxID=209 RepID=UPI002625D358|nr:terminase family protein [Helicobacter sp. UBA3407]
MLNAQNPTQKDKELALRAMCKKDFKTFLYTKWVRYDNAKFYHNWHFEYLSEILSCTLPSYVKPKGFPLQKRVIINMPPSYGKTETIARSFIAWALGNDPTRKFIYISYSDDLCKEISIKVRKLIKSEFFRNVFNFTPIFLQDKTEAFTLSNGGGCFFTTLKGAITGFHAHTILVDDPIKVSEMTSKSARDSVNRNFTGSVLSRLLGDEASIIILMQRLGDEDLCGYLTNPRNFENEICEDWNIVKLQALNKEAQTYKIGKFTYHREANTPLFPARHSLESLQHLRLAMGEDEFATQYQQEPQATEAGFFDKQYYREIPLYELGEHNLYIFVDNATSMNTRADNRAIGAIAVDKKDGLERYTLLDLSFGIWSEEETCAQIIEMCLSYPKASVYIEREGGGETLNRILQKEIVRANANLKAKAQEIIVNPINVYSASRKISKVEKIKALRSYYNTGYLCVKIGAKGKEQFLKELLSFNPTKPFLKDDCIDIVASAVAHTEVKAPYIKEQRVVKTSRFLRARSWNI